MTGENWCTPCPRKFQHNLDTNSLVKRYTDMTKSKKKRIRKRAKKSESLRKRLDLDDMYDANFVPETQNQCNNDVICNKQSNDETSNSPITVPDTQDDSLPTSATPLPSLVISETKLAKSEATNDKSDNEDSGADSMSPPLINSRPPSPGSPSLNSMLASQSQSLNNIMLASPDLGATPIQTLLSASAIDRIMPPSPMSDNNQVLRDLNSALLCSRLECDNKDNNIWCLSEQVKSLQIEMCLKDEKMKMIDETLELKSTSEDMLKKKTAQLEKLVKKQKQDIIKLHNQLDSNIKEYVQTIDELSSKLNNLHKERDILCAKVESLTTLSSQFKVDRPTEPSMKQPPAKPLYYRGHWNIMSTFYPSPLRYQNVTVPTAEHLLFYRCAIFHDDYALANQILRTHRPDQAKKLGKKITRSAMWLEIEVDILIEIFLLKAEQHATFKQALIGSMPRPLIQNIETDKKWGFGEDGDGDNLCGVALMEARAIILSTQQKVPSAPASRSVIDATVQQDTPHGPSTRPVSQDTTQQNVPSRPVPQHVIQQNVPSSQAPVSQDMTQHNVPSRPVQVSQYTTQQNVAPCPVSQVTTQKNVPHVPSCHPVSQTMIQVPPTCPTSGQPIETVVVGDSTSKFMLNALKEQGISNCVVYPFPGYRVEDIEKKLPDFIGLSPKYLIFMCGTNNMPTNSVPQTMSKLKSLIDAAKLLMPQTHIIMSGILQRLDLPYLNQDINAVNEGLSRMNCPHVTHVDHTPTIRNLEKVLQWSDKLHPRRCGTRQMAVNIKDHLDKLQQKSYSQALQGQSYQYFQQSQPSTQTRNDNQRPNHGNQQGIPTLITNRPEHNNLSTYPRGRHNYRYAMGTS